MESYLPLDRLRAYFEANLERFVREHPRRMVLLESDGDKISEAFFNGDNDMEEYIQRKYAETFGRIMYSSKIPDRIKIKQRFRRLFR